MRGFVFGAIALLVLLTGCGIGGVWLDPSNAASRPPDPFLSHWIKEGMTRENRRNDSWACGAAPTVYAADYAVFSREQYSGAKSVKEDSEIGERLRKQWMVCMESKGYVYLYKCDARCLHP
jgi:hypothetical protein